MTPAIPILGRTVRNLRRAQEIITLLGVYGFTDVVQDLGLDRLVLRGKRLVGMAAPSDRVAREPQAVRLRRAMESLGPTFIKMAQILSTRPDLIPRTWADEFTRLQYDVPPVAAGMIRAHIESLYEGRIGDYFASVEDKAFAAASIAQAHHATLLDGTPVVLKVLRPGIGRVVEADIEILAALAAFVENHFQNLGYSPKKVVEQFARQVRRELDMIHEGRATDRMARAFADDPHVSFPRVFWEQTREGVLCLERIDGVLLSKHEEAGFSEDELERIVAYGVDAVFRQCFQIGFFHADPHPGNIIVSREDGDVHLCFIDCGMTGHLDPHSGELLADLVHGTIGGDIDRVIDSVIALTGANPSIAADRDLRADAWEFIAQFEAVSLDQLHMGSLLSEFFERIRRHRLTCPADIMYLIKAVTTIEGVGEALCPTFDIVSHVRPHMERLIRRRYGFGAMRRRVERGSIAWAELTETIPRYIRELADRFRKDQIRVSLQHEGLDQVTREIERASRHISFALVVSGLVVAGAILVLADAIAGAGKGAMFYAGVGAFAVAAVLAAARLLVVGRA